MRLHVYDIEGKVLLCTDFQCRELVTRTLRGVVRLPSLLPSFEIRLAHTIRTFSSVSFSLETIKS